MHHKVQQVTDEISARSAKMRGAYLARIEKANLSGAQRQVLSCGNLAHGFAACVAHEKEAMRGMSKPNIAIISAYNDLLSAHQPYEHYPALLKQAVHAAGGIAQFAAGVPAMCDGITQGQAGMDLSLMSRDLIAMAAAVGLSHNLFDGGLMLGICDKIVPGLLMSALHFGHLPFVFVPAGPMPSGISNLEKSRIRQLYAQNKVSKDELLEAEVLSYHSPGTCTFYGTANSNQLVVEIMGLQLPGSSFVHPNTPLRDAYTKAAGEQVVRLTALSGHSSPIGKLVTVKTIVNAIVGLLATGGSTNHTMHLVAIARAAGICINWDDFSKLSKITPLLARIYPNGGADINAFAQAGGTAYLIHTLLDADLLHADVETVAGFGLERYTKKPQFDQNELTWIDGPTESLDRTVLRATDSPFNSHGGLQVLTGNLGRAVMKTSALSDQYLTVEAEACVFHSQDALEAAFKAGDLERDCVVVVSFQGPRACGMPELHKLTPFLEVLQGRGFHVALVTDGRMSGASGKVPAAIHVTPEAFAGGTIAKIQSGDRVLVDGKNGVFQVLLSDAELAKRSVISASLTDHHYGVGREMFTTLRRELSGAELGACSLFGYEL
ncbi:MAG: phosphogluconate dehydratase [Legionellales bacterium RIFCSPHIGHO2_12_FULL_42_9]|nr:MAG: phosphogluconate dehydratase [Legionellales bacterium RIFCSPHIGHO2_12_FULL_42_9]